MNEENTFDVIIIGGGPSGTAAALYAERVGLKTLLVDKDNFPRDKICGDAVSGKSMTILDELGLIKEAQELPGAIVKSIVFGSPSNHQVDIPLYENKTKGIPAGLVIKREYFDNFLFQKVKNSTCKCLENFKVKDILLQDGFVVGIKGTNNENVQQEFNAKIILGADGYNSIIARKTNLYEHDPKHWVVALRQYFKNVKGMTNQLEIHYVKEAQPGYFWIFPLEGGNANVGIGMLHESIKANKIDLKELLKNVLESDTFKDRFKNAESTEKPKGWNLPVASKHRKNHGNGFMLLGDAAGLIDPFTGEGIGNALYSAKYAVEVASKAIKNKIYTQEFLKEYDEKLWKRLGSEFAVSTKLQKVGRLKPLLNFVVSKAEKNESVRDVLSGMMSNSIPKKELANPLFYLKLFFS